MSHLCGSLDRVVVFGIIAGIISSVGIVIANKHLWIIGFKYMVTLSFIHFVMTAVSMRVFQSIGLFDYKPTDAMQIVPFSISIAASVIFMNLNLAYNSVGLYQMSKLMCVPCILLFQYFMQKQTVSRPILFSLVILLLGIGLATVSDVSLNFTGSVMALLAILSTTLCQIWTNTKQKDLGLNAMQLLYHTSPYTALAMFAMIPMFDSVYTTSDSIGLVDFRWQPHLIGMIVFTAVFAIGVNLTNFLIIGRTSPVTYQVVGHLKTCLVLGFGFLLFDHRLDNRNLIGVITALLGTILYTELKRRESLPGGSPSTPSPSNASSSSSSSSSTSSSSSSIALKEMKLTAIPSRETDTDVNITDIESGSESSDIQGVGHVMYQPRKGE